jgi:predicted permease
MKRLLRIGSVERDINEELAFHFAEAVEELKRRGRTQAEAEAEVRRRFGDETRYRNELEIIDRSRERRMAWTDRLEAVREAVRQALRSLARTPALTAGVVLVFALGVGANATMLEIVDRLLLRPPDHVVAPDAVHRVVIDRYIPWQGVRNQSQSMTYPDYLDLRAGEAFSAVAGYASRELTLGRGEAAHEVQGVLATGDYFDLIGALPLRGRFFTNEEAKVGGERVAVLGFGYWQRQFGGSPDVLGRSIDLGSGVYTIIGVAPKGLTSIDLKAADVWLPLEVAQADIAGDAWVNSRNWWWMQTLVRRAEGASVERADAEATALHRTARAEWVSSRAAEGSNDTYPKDTRIAMYPLSIAKLPDAGAEATVAQWLTGVALIVLLIACINVANLLFARMLRGQREIGIRLALGVTRARLIGRIVLEGALLGLLGGGAALAVAYWGGGYLRRALLPDVAWNEFALGRTVIVSTVALALTAGVLSALMPAIQAARRDVGSVLRMSAGGITRSALRVRTGLSLLQAALSVLLLVGAGLFVRSVANISAVDHGFDPDNLLFANTVSTRGAIAPAEEFTLARRALERARLQPGVQHAALTSAMPFWSYIVTSIEIEGVDSLPTMRGGGPYVQMIAGEYFDAMGMSIVSGQDFGDGREYSVVVNETMARAIEPAGAVLGRCVYIDPDEENRPPCAPIVGVVEDATRSDLREEPVMQYYVNVPESFNRAAEYMPYATLMLRVSEGSENAVVPAIRREILGLDGRIRFVDIAPLQERMDPLARSWKLGATLFSVFGLLALLVAAVGLYSVLAFDVTQRTRELGLRTALGAPVSRLVGMVIGHGMRVTMVGVALGLVIAALLAPRIEPLLFDVSAFDPPTYLVVGTGLLVVAFVASWIPAWRAARVDPNVALKAD